MDPGINPHLTVLEHKELSVSREGSETSLSSAEAAVLMRVAERRPGFCEWSYSSVRVAQYCGVVNLGQRMLEVLPKVESRSDPARGRGVLLRLLRASGALEGVEVLPAGQFLDRSPLLEIFISLFMDSVTNLVRGGLLRQYSEQEDDLQVVRGRIHLARQFGTHFNRPDVIASRFDEHTADNQWNRAVKAALQATRPWIVSGELHRRWVELMAAFDDVADVLPTPAALNRFVFDRQAVRYRRTMDWVRWILTLLSPALRAGEAHVPSVLFDMNVVFERAAASVIRRRLSEISPRIEVQAQARGQYLARVIGPAMRRAFALRPDMLVREGKRLLLVADAKWKRVRVSRSGYMIPDRSDIYQMHAYASAFRVDRLALIYPTHGGTVYSSPTEFRLPEVGGCQPIVTVVCIDVQHDDLPITSGEDALVIDPATS